MHSKLFITIILAFLLFACGSSKKTNPETPAENTSKYELLKGVNWILGTWQMDNQPGITKETWKQLNDSVFIGESATIGSGKDTLFYETIRIEQRGNDLFYIPVVTDQNEGKPVEFKNAMVESIPATGKYVEFQNPEHNFPQTISYWLNGDSLIAEISGTLEGKMHSEKFPMVRME